MHGWRNKMMAISTVSAAGVDKSISKSNKPSQFLFSRKNEKIHLQQLPNSSHNLLLHGKNPSIMRINARTPDARIFLSPRAVSSFAHFRDIFPRVFSFVPKRRRRPGEPIFTAADLGTR